MIYQIRLDLNTQIKVTFYLFNSNLSCEFVARWETFSVSLIYCSPDTSESISAYNKLHDCETFSTIFHEAFVRHFKREYNERKNLRSDYFVILIMLTRFE